MKNLRPELIMNILLLGIEATAQIADKEILTLAGGSGGEDAETSAGCILVDSVRAEVYIAMVTSDSTLPVTDQVSVLGPWAAGEKNTYLAIYDMELRVLLYGCYIRGPKSIIVQAMMWSGKPGEILLAGSTGSKDLPVTSDARQKQLAGYWDNWYARFSTEHRRFTYCTYTGGSGYDFCYSALVASDGRLLLAGSTSSTDLPQLHTAITKKYIDGYSDAAVFVLLEDSLEYVVTLGGDNYDLIAGIFELESSYVMTGETRSSNFPVTMNCIQAEYGGGGDATLLDVSKEFSSLHYSTMLGGSGTEWLITSRQFGNIIHLMGESSAGRGGFPTTEEPRGYDTVGLYSGFHVIYDASKDSIVCSSLIIGSGAEQVLDVSMIDEERCILLVHAIADSLIGVENTYSGNYYRSMDVLVLVDANDYSYLEVQLLHSGEMWDYIGQLQQTSAGLFFTGQTNIAVNVNPGGHRTTYLGGTEAFIGKLHLNINAQEALRPPVASLLSLSPFPNPARAAATALLAAAPGAYTLRIHGSDGREWRSQRVYCDGGGGSVSVPLDGLAAGHYQLSAVDAQGRIVARSALVVEGR